MNPLAALAPATAADICRGFERRPEAEEVQIDASFITSLRLLRQVEDSLSLGAGLGMLTITREDAQQWLRGGGSGGSLDILSVRAATGADQ